MTKEEYLATLSDEHRKLIEILSSMLRKNDGNISEGIIGTMGKIMLGYKQGEEFKYAFAIQKSHFSFHNMVMYCYPELREKYHTALPGARFQKGCINFRNTEDFPFAHFEELIRESASYPYPLEQQRKRQGRP